MKIFPRPLRITTLVTVVTISLLSLGIIAATGNGIEFMELMAKGLGVIAFTINLNLFVSGAILVLFGGAIAIRYRKKSKRKPGKVIKALKVIWYFFVAINAVNLLVWGLIYGMLLIMNQYNEYQRPGSQELLVWEFQPRQYELRDNKIYMTVAGETTLLLENVENIDALRTGPDGYTVHFNAKGDIDWLPSYCAHPGLPAQVPYGADKPKSAPWSFEVIGSAAHLSACGRWGKAGGYLKQSNYFAYVRDTGKAITLVLEDTSTGRELHFDMAREAWEELLTSLGNDTYAVEYGVSYGLPEFMGIRGVDGHIYYYPQVDAMAADGKILMGFSHLVIAIDTIHQKFLGSELLTAPTYDVSADMFDFLANSTSPLVGLMGVNQMQAIFDMSGSLLQVEPFTNIAAVNYGYEFHFFEAPLVEWDRRGILYLHAYGTVDAMDTYISEKERVQYDSIDGWTNDQIEAKKIELEKRLQRTGAFLEVQCMTEANLYCRGLVRGKEYRMVPGGKLEKR